MPKMSVLFYNLPDGSYPAEDFLNNLDIKMRAKMLRTIGMLQENGTDLRMPHSEHLDDGIFELRAKQGSNISRVLYFFFDGAKVILTNGFVKKTQKTPPSELDRAKRYRKEYFSRKENARENL